MAASISKLIGIAAATLLIVGCASSGGGKSVDTAQKENDYRQFLKAVPDLSKQQIGNPAADVLFSGIEGIAKRVHNSFQLYAKNMDSDEGALGQRLEAVRAEKGNDAYLATVKEMNSKDKAMYASYIDNQTKLTREQVKMLPEAIKVVAGLKSLDPKQLVANPMQLPRVGGALKTAASQGEYSIKALEYMKTMNDVMENAKQYTGK